MDPTYPRLFSPIKLGPTEIPNRFYFAPHGVHFTVGSGKPSQDYVHYKVARVKDHGCGLVVSSMTVTDRARNAQPSVYLKENIAAFRVLADRVHEAGGKIFGQIWYWWGTCGTWQPYSSPAPALSPSAVQFMPQLFTIGDALAARMFAHATFEAQKFARFVGEPDAPNSFAEAYFRENPREFAVTAADAAR